MRPNTCQWMMFGCHSLSFIPQPGPQPTFLTVSRAAESVRDNHPVHYFAHQCPLAGDHLPIEVQNLLCECFSNIFPPS
jgi:hypothetical protein